MAYQVAMDPFPALYQYNTTERAQGCLDSRSSPILFRAFLKDCHQFSTTQLVYKKSFYPCLLFYVKPKNSCNLLQFLSSPNLVCLAVCVIIHTAKSGAQQKGRADVSRHSNQGMLSSPHRESVLRIRNQSFGSGLKSVSDPDPAWSLFRIRIRPEVCFGSGFESGSKSEFKSGLESRLETGQNFFFVLKFLPSLIFKHKKAAFPQPRDLVTNKERNKLQDSDPDPLVRRTDPRIRIRANMSRIHNSAYNYL